jgi:hypothetical protein
MLWTTLQAGKAHASPDTTAPRVLHAVVQKGMIGQNVDVRVQFQDQSEIFEPKLYFRRVGELEYAAIDLVQGAKGEWIGTIPATFVTRDVEYFLEAFDIMGNGPGRNGSPEKPHLIKVVTRMDPQPPQQIQPQQTVTNQQPLANNNVTQTTPMAPAPVYKQWWFWVVMVLGAGAVAGVTVGVLCGTSAIPCGAATPTGPINAVTIEVRGPDPRSGL